MNHTKPLLAATALFLASFCIASQAEAAKPTTGLKVTLREYTRQFEIAPGETGIVASACLAGETVLGGSATGWSANAKQSGSNLFFDGTRSGWSIEYRNDGTEAIQVYAVTGALCTAGTLTSGESG